MTIQTTSGSVALLQALLTHEVLPLPLEEVEMADLKFLSVCRLVRWGEIEVIIKDGLPVMGRLERLDWKFS